jgi:hypothetical protein
LEHEGAADFVEKSDDLSFRRDQTMVLNGKNWEIDFLTALRR